MNEFFFFRLGFRLRLAPFDRSKTAPVMSHSDWPSSGAVWFIKSELSKSSPKSSSLELHYKKNHKNLQKNTKKIKTYPWWWIHNLFYRIKYLKIEKLNLEFRTNSNISGRQNIWIFENFHSSIASVFFFFAIGSSKFLLFQGFKKYFRSKVHRIWVENFRANFRIAFFGRRHIVMHIIRKLSISSSD